MRDEFNEIAKLANVDPIPPPYKYEADPELCAGNNHADYGTDSDGDCLGCGEYVIKDYAIAQDDEADRNIHDIVDEQLRSEGR